MKTRGSFHWLRRLGSRPFFPVSVHLHSPTIVVIKRQIGVEVVALLHGIPTKQPGNSYKFVGIFKGGDDWVCAGRVKAWNADN